MDLSWTRIVWKILENLEEVHTFVEATGEVQTCVEAPGEVHTCVEGCGRLWNVGELSRFFHSNLVNTCTY